MTQRTSRFSVSLSYDEAKVFYTGSKNRIQVTALMVRALTFLGLPYNLSSQLGVQGRFVITYDGEGKLLSLVRDD